MPSPPSPSAPSPRPGLRVVTRPPAHRPGGPPPWSGLTTSERTGIGLAGVVAAVGRRPPGSGQTVDPVVDPALIGQFRAFTGVDPSARPAAVLVALFEDEDEDEGEARVVLTVRSDRLRSHRGEVAFPGGRLDPGESVEAAALREAHEEVRLDPASVSLVGRLTPMPTVSSNTVMTPVVASLDARPALVPAPDEVDRVFDVALADLVAEGAFREELWSVPGRPGSDGRPGGEFPVWFFTAGGELIWGATARVLTELLCVVLSLPGPVPGP